MLNKSIESDQEIKKVFKDYGVHFRRFESIIEQGKTHALHLRSVIYI